MATLNISLPDGMRKWVDTQVGDEYANASDYIRDLIRHDQRQREALKLALIEAEQSGRSTRKISDIINDTKAKLEHG
ncbi:MAG: type II toxin-antitoxin system ParD family antitoxin [gamma proteobacterium endosymbiont of Lamellibrachia anaximandri]|nr:type II toxin-antitoxin system ParD family antitoxin [gamma proteobacterium endosymbiont of Lamellibrachia anaximandri]MBL3535146.1 type II toxin-antitoxin system ParD family antitoxin [gamma proteobacterium endosymbiont of Lamellibrachia anaximandri]